MKEMKVIRKTGLALCILLLGAGNLWCVQSAEPVSPSLDAGTQALVQAGIDEQDARHMIRLMVQNRFQEETMLKAQALVMNTHRAGLPAEKVMHKAFEGLAKGAGEPQILQAMERVQARYAYAYQQAESLTPEPQRMRRMGDVLAEALSSGVSPDDADRVMDRLRSRTRDTTQDQDRNQDPDKEQDRDRRRLGTPDEVEGYARECLLTLRDLSRCGVSSAGASGLVGQAMQHQYTQQEMRTLRQSFLERARFGNPQALARQYASAIQAGERADRLGGAGGTSGAAYGGAAASQGPSGQSDMSGGSGGTSGGGTSGGGTSGGGSGSGGGGGSGKGGRR